MSWQSWLFAFNVTVPGLLMLLIGVGLKRLKWIDEHFINTTSRLVFYLALPCLMFFSIANNHTDISSHYRLAIYGALSTFVSYLLLELVAPFLIKQRNERGIFVQGGFRSNIAVIGLSYSSLAYGQQGLILGSIYLVSTVILFNILSLITLARTLSPDNNHGFDIKKLFRDVVTNPLILAIVLGVICSYLMIPIPDPLIRTGQFLSGLTLPLAMICAGASINLRMMFRSSNTAIYATIARSLVIPLLITAGAYLFGFHGIELGVIFLLTSTPTAAAGYIMVRTMGGNSTLAANIIVMTTISSFFTAVIGLSVLRSMALI